MGGVVIGRLEVGSGTVGVTGLADSSRARGGITAGVSGLDGEAVLGEDRVGAHIDAGHVPEDGVLGLGVLELQDVLLGLVGGQLDGDTTAIGVGAPLLAESAAVGGDGLHGTDVLGHGPGVDVVVQGVGDHDGATGSTVTAGDHAGGQSRGQSGEGSGNADSLGEHHFDM